jgi:hypothetical protein
LASSACDQRITHHGNTGGHLPRFGFEISRTDVADFMIHVVENQLSIRKVVGVCN